jgi:Lipid A 3-O-deacylase (PagL)
MKPTRLSCRPLAALLFLLPALPSAAAQFSLEVGTSYVDSHSTPTAFGELVFDDRYFGGSRFSWAPDITAGWIDGRSVARYRDARPSLSDNIWLLAAGARFHYGSPDAWYRPLFFSFQPALHTGRTQGLSSSYEFVSTLGWQAKHWMVGVRHISNGSFEGPNRGETMVLVGVTF